MSLNENFSDLKSKYRSLFAECVEEIQLQLASGRIIDDIECYYKENFRKYFDNIMRERNEYTCACCGVCCKFAVSEFSPEELNLKAQNGDNFATQFIQTFIPYESIEDARLIYPEYVEFLEKEAQGHFYIYHCPKVTDDNMCPDYENRPQICRDFPEYSSMFLPKTCAFNPWKLKSESVWLKLNAVMEILDFYKNNKKDL